MKLLFLIGIVITVLSDHTLSQVIVEQDFDGANTWTYTSNPSQNNASCQSNGDVWNVVSNLGNITIPNGTGDFWGVQDLDGAGGCGTSGVGTLDFSTINISGCTNVSISFDFEVDGFNAVGDNFSYIVTIDGTPQSEVFLCNGCDQQDLEGTETINIPNGSTSLSLQIRYEVNGGSDYSGVDNFSVSGSCGALNSISTSNLSSLTYSVDCSTDDTGAIDFTTIGTFNGGNIFTAELSDPTGSFATSSSIGTLTASGTDPSGTINFTIPAGTLAGTAYRIRVVSSNPISISPDNGTDITISSPYCGPTSCMDESFVNSGSSGSYSTETWVGDDGYTFTATDARSDQNINGDAITVRNGSLSANGVTGGIGDLTLTTQRVFSGGTGNLDVFVNGTFVGNIPYDGTVQTTTITGINVPGTINVDILTPSNGDRVAMDDLQWTCYVSTNTISSTNVSALTFNIDCSTGDSGTIAFTSVGVFNTGNIFTAQLSDVTGSFASATDIGTLALDGTDPSGTINFTVPAGTQTGTSYRIRVVSDNPSTTGSDNGVDITVNLSGGPCVMTPPHLTSVIINSCDQTCNEGYNEIVFGNSGDYAFDVNTSGFNFSYGSTYPGTNYTDALVNNATTIQELNDSAGCPGLFVDAAGTTIPAGASWMLAYTDICPEALDWTGLCGSGPIYVILQNDSDWSLSGNFANSTSSIRYFQTSITTTSGTTETIDYTTDGTQYSNSDGTYANFISNGGPASAYGDDDCNLTSVVLPVELLDMNIKKDKTGVIISWSTATERNNSHFILSHSNDGFNFNTISTIHGAGTTTESNYYSDIHFSPKQGVNYYRLQSVDFDGTTYLKGIRALEFSLGNTYYDYSNNIIHTKSIGDYNVVNLAGQVIKHKENTSEIPFLGTGIYVVQNLNTGEAEKLVIH